MIFALGVYALVVSIIDTMMFALVSKELGMDYGFAALGTVTTGLTYLGLFYAKYLFDTEQGRRLSSIFSRWEVGFNKQLEAIAKQAKEIDRIRGELKETIAQLAPDRSSIANSLVARVNMAVDEAFRRLEGSTKERLESFMAEYFYVVEDARSRAFRALPFVEEILSISDKNERLRLIDTWLRGIQGDDAAWKSLADYFRKRKQK